MSKLYKKKNSHKADKNQKNTKKLDRVEMDSARSSRNDPEWYRLNDRLLNDAASLAFSTKSGDPVVIYRGNGTSYMKDTSSFNGIMTIVTAPTLGNPQNITDALNAAARDFQAAVRKMNSGSNNNITAPMYGMYLNALGSCYSVYAYMTRIYGIATTYNVKNKFMPRFLIEALGVDFDDVNANLANFRAAINIFARKLNYYAVPNSLSVMKRYQFIYGNVYADTDDMKAQLYMFKPYAFHKYGEPGTASEDRVGTLYYSKLEDTNPGNRLTVNDLVNFMDDIYAPLLTSQDFDIISGDIRRAFAPENLTSVNYIDEFYMVIPTVDRDVLSQIHNLNTLFTTNPDSSKVSGLLEGFGTVSLDLSETQNGGALTIKTEYASASEPFTYNQVLDMEQEKPDPASVMEATRLKHFSIADYDDDLGMYRCEISTCGMEVPLFMEMFRLVYTGNVASLAKEIGHTICRSTLFSSSIYNYRIYPLLYCLQGSGNTAQIETIRGEINNWTTIDAQTLKRMNEVAMLSMYTLR